MPDSARPLDVYQNVQQFRLPDGMINYDHLLVAVLNSLSLAGVSLKKFLVARVFSNGGPITNGEIVDIGLRLFGEEDEVEKYRLMLEEFGCEFGYTPIEREICEATLHELASARAVLAVSGRPPEVLKPLVEATCDALGFKFAKYNS